MNILVKTMYVGPPAAALLSVQQHIVCADTVCRLLRVQGVFLHELCVH